MNSKIKYLVTLPSFGRKFPLEPSKNELEDILQDAFGAWGKRVIDGYFIEGSGYYPQNLAFFVVPYHWNGNERVWIGSLIATDEKVGDFEFTYYDKIGLIREYQGNDIMRNMIRKARLVTDKKGVIKPSILRTSEERLNERYAEESDIKTPTKINGFYVHGFGFKGGEAELFNFSLAAQYIASKPSTVIPIESLICIPAY